MERLDAADIAQQFEPAQAMDRGVAIGRGCGSGSEDQVLPFHWKPILVEVDDVVVPCPTAQQLVLEPQAIALRAALAEGKVTTDQAMPFHCCMVPVVPVPARPGPTAQQADDEEQLIDDRPLEVAADTVPQEVPFH